MKCRDIQIELSTGNGAPDPVIEKHLSMCEECRRFQKSLTVIEENLTEDAAIRLPTVAAERIRNAIRETEVKPPAFRLNIQLRYAVAAAIFIGLFYVLSIHQTYSAEAQIKQMIDSAAKISSLHMTTWAHKRNKGPLELIEDVWYDHGKWRKISTPDYGGDSIVLTKKLQLIFYRYDHKKHRVLQAHELAPQPRITNWDKFTSGYFPKGATFTAKRITTTVNNDRTYDVVDVQSVGYQERMLYTIDRSTSFPVRAVKQDYNYKTKTWETDGVITFECNIKIDPKIFDPAVLNTATGTALSKMILSKPAPIP